jgi:hypothetical protein
MRRRSTILLLVAAAVCAASFGIYRATAPGPAEGPGAVAVENARADWSYAIPPGTGARLDQGDPVEILPARIDARVGQVIRIVNHDNRGYLLGPFYVGAHETLLQRFTTPGTFKGACAVHPSGRIVLDVGS